MVLQWHARALLWHCHGTAMALPWHCHGTPMAFPWHCHGAVMAQCHYRAILSWRCHITVMATPWDCHDAAVHYHGSAMALHGMPWLPRDSHVGDVKVPWQCCVVAMALPRHPNATFDARRAFYVIPIVDQGLGQFEVKPLKPFCG